MSPCSSTVPDSALLDSVASPDPPGDSTLARLTEHVRALLPVCLLYTSDAADD